MKNKILDEARICTKKLLEMYLSYKNVSELLISSPEKDKENFLQKQKEIADTMVFPTPTVWLMYKTEAYKNTDCAIKTLGDLRRHVSSVDDICHKRFIFLTSHLHNNEIFIENKKIFPDTIKMNEFYSNQKIISLTNQKDFLEIWQSYEFFRKNGAVAKWQNFHINP